MKKIALILLGFIFVVSIGSIIIVRAFNNEKINVLIYGLDGMQGREGERSDTIILANYNFENNQMTITSIPRDSYVKITCKNNEYDKINHAYAFGGQKCLNETVSQLFGISNIKNVSLDFESVVKIVDYFGLIEIVPSNSFCQSDINGEKTYCFEKDKKILLDGNQTLAYMRARKSLPNGDFDRIKNQRQVMKTLMNKFMKLSIIEKITFYNKVKIYIYTDLELKDFNIKKALNVNQIKLNEYTLIGEDFINDYYYYKLDKNYLEKIKKYYK